MATSSNFIRTDSFALIFSGLGLMGFCFLALFVYGQFITITCIKMKDGQVDCTKETSWYNLWPVSPPEVLPHIIRANVDTSCSTGPGSSYNCYSNVLVIENEDKSLEIGSPAFNETTAAEALIKINAYIIQSGDTPLVIECKNVERSIFMAAPFFVSGAAALWIACFGYPTKVFVRRQANRKNIAQKQKQGNRSIRRK
jgi:hypothetical protein